MNACCGIGGISDDDDAVDDDDDVATEDLEGPSASEPLPKLASMFLSTLNSINLFQVRPNFQRTKYLRNILRDILVTYSYWSPL